jgi:RimJ/RimL family protein N-acetyltransferase
VGDCTLFWLSQIHQQGEIGFIFHPAFQGRGLASEAAGAMLRLGFEGLGLHRIIGRCDGRNQASAGVMERNGMRREAHLIENEFVKGEWTDELIYAILRREWEASAPARD